MAPTPLSIVDAFTGEPFRGNPAAVCRLPAAAEDRWMQRVAAELGFSETAFVHRQGDVVGLRWFTPMVEVELCGHATLAAAHVLWEEGEVESGATIRFATASGELSAARRGPWIELDFPAEPAQPVAPAGELLAALGITGEVPYTGRNRFDELVLLPSEAAVRALAPDFARLARTSDRGVMVTARAEGESWDFVSRFFAPAVGIDEDPVTGSAHCCLGPFWGERLDKQELLAVQLSPRGGEVRVRLRGPRVTLGGRAVTVVTGDLRV